MTEQLDITQANAIPRKTLVVDLPSGEIRTEVGADGIFMVFDCDCMDALPYCHANCCGMAGTLVRPDEVDKLDQMAEELRNRLVNFNPHRKEHEMKRDADGFCTALDREKCLCTIYDNRPKTCQDFHCSRGMNRGWDLGLIRRFKEYER